MDTIVSIAIPIYNVSKYIEICAHSLFAQTFKNIEYIFVDDCTPDNSIDILKKVITLYPNRKKSIHIIHHEQNKGLAAARNTALDNAHGKYILHVDSDDYIELDAIEILYKKAIEDKADIIICDYYAEWSNKKKWIKQKFHPNNIEFLKQILNAETASFHANKFIKRNLYVDNQLRMYEGLNYGEDFSMTTRLVYCANKISKIDKPLYHYIQTNTSAYTKTRNSKTFEDLFNILDLLTPLFQR